MKVKHYFYATLCILLLAAAGFTTWRLASRPMPLPHFPETAAGLPAAVIEVEPDFGWRTGDIIPLRIYLREPAGIVCDTRSLSVNGDTRLRDLSIAYQAMPDGTRVVRLDVQMQAFVWQQKLKTSLKIDYRLAGSRQRKQLQLPDLEFSTSKTFDGDKSSKHPKDPPAVFVHSHAWVFTLCLGTAAFAVCACSFWYLLKRPVYKRTKKAALVPQSDAWKAAIKQVQAILARLKAGEPQLDLLKNLDGLLRRLYNVEAVTVQDLQSLSDKDHPELTSLTLASQYCQQVIYTGKPQLDYGEISNLVDLVDEALAVLPRFNPASLGKFADCVKTKR